MRITPLVGSLAGLGFNGLSRFCDHIFVPSMVARGVYHWCLGMFVLCVRVRGA